MDSVPLSSSVKVSPQRHPKIPLTSRFIKGEVLLLSVLPLFCKEGRREIYLFLATVRNVLSIGKTRAMMVSAISTPLIGRRKKMVYTQRISHLYQQ
jgi:hypothetical protein